jgi:phosphonate transport system substrate-binding protein
MTVSPDFSPDHIAGWYIFNTWFQKQTGQAIHLELYDSFEKQREDIKNDKIDLIYANPYDASMLVRDKGFTSLVAPQGKADEAMICVNSESDYKLVEDLKSGCKVATANDPEVSTIGMIMLEPADLSAENIQISEYKNYVMVAKNLINNNADAGFFLKEAYDDMSNFIKSQIRPIITSEISVIHHSFLVSPHFFENSGMDESAVKNLLLEMHDNDQGASTLKSLGMQKWQNQDKEDVEYMIDLMDTLLT